LPKRRAAAERVGLSAGFSAETCVQVRQTTKQAVVQRFGLTSDRKAAQRPPAQVPSTKVNKAAFFTRGALLFRAHNQPPD